MLKSPGDRARNAGRQRPRSSTDRALGFEPRGWGFESLRGRHSSFGKMRFLEVKARIPKLNAPEHLRRSPPEPGPLFTLIKEQRYRVRIGSRTEVLPVEELISGVACRSPFRFRRGEWSREASLAKGC